MDKYIYVAGAINADNVITALGNIQRGQRVAARVLMMGYIPFCPFLDFQFFLQLREGEEITFEQIRNYSMAWLKKCDLLFLVPGWEDSVGTKAEIEEAHHLRIPVVESWRTLETYWKFP